MRLIRQSVDDVFDEEFEAKAFAQAYYPYLVFGFEQFQERVGQELLLEVLLQVHHRHVQHVHGLIEPRVDPQLLAQTGVLGEAGSHATASSRARSRAVRVGPRYNWATRSS